MATSGPILGIDTSSRRGSVALLGVEARVRPLDGEQDHSRRLLPAIEALLLEAGCRPAELRGLGVALGPGSFTGLRVGLSTAQGLALALGLPCHGVDTFDAWAAHLGPAELLAVGLDAFRGELLGALFERGRLVLGPWSATPEEFVARLPRGTLCAGGGVELYAERIRAAGQELRLSGQEPYLAGTVTRLAREALGRGAKGAARELRPLYLREAYARRA